MNIEYNWLVFSAYALHKAIHISTLTLNGGEIPQSHERVVPMCHQYGIVAHLQAVEYVRTKVFINQIYI